MKQSLLISLECWPDPAGIHWTTAELTECHGDGTEYCNAYGNLRHFSAALQRSCGDPAAILRPSPVQIKDRYRQDR